MFKELRKIWCDIATNPKTGKYSLSRLQPIWATFVVSILTLPFFIELHIYPVLSFNLTQPPTEVLYGWMAVAIGTGGLLLANKNKAKPNETLIEEENG